MSIKIKVKTAINLGISNLIRVLIYKIGIITALNNVNRLHGVFSQGSWFSMNTQQQNLKIKKNAQQEISLSSTTCKDLVTFQAFDLTKHLIPDGLDWHRNVLNRQLVPNHHQPWYQLPDFSSELGDIKGVWEASRFSWLFPLVKVAASGNYHALDILNERLQSWASENPPYLGVNWKCGQEASIRVMHLAMAALLLSQSHSPSTALMQAIKLHLERIAPTLIYAIAQDNNHGTSEAAALFIGGTWLAQQGNNTGQRWAKQGRKWLENRAKRLIASDGSFSQYSTNYHRVMLDTYSMAEIWRKYHKLPEFSAQLIERLKAATNWLYQMTDANNGNVPNLGANDGARLLPLTKTDYRDFRPSVQLASVLFVGCTAYTKNGSYDEPLQWFKLNKPEKTLAPLSSFHFPHGGYAGLRDISCQAFVLLNYPRFRFRPSQSDALHLDFWVRNENLLRDGGTYSYNAGDKFIHYYGGVESHNTIEFDARDQMPRLSRFLLGNWLKANSVVFDESLGICQASYTDHQKATHQRRVVLENNRLIVVDNISGFKEKAILRWRLKPDNWQINGHSITNGNHVITIQADVPLERFEIIEGRESLYYYNETVIPVIEVELASTSQIITEYRY